MAVNTIFLFVCVIHTFNTRFSALKLKYCSHFYACSFRTELNRTLLTESCDALHSLDILTGPGLCRSAAVFYNDYQLGNY